VDIVSSPPQDGVCLQISDSTVTGVVLTTTDIKKTQSVPFVLLHSTLCIKLSTVAREKKIQPTKVNLYLSAAFPCIFIAIGPATLKMAP